MKVKDLVLYQIATDRHYKVGDKLEFGRTYNYQGTRVIKGDKTFNGRLYKDGFNFVDGKVDFDNKKLVLKLSKELEEYDFILRELAYEEVRRSQFKFLPSRLKCMFLSDNKEACMKNLKIFHNKGHGIFFQAIAVKVSGNIFYVREFPAVRKGISFGNYLEDAKKYWGQNQNSDKPPFEILFEGDAEVVEIIDEYEYKREE